MTKSVICDILKGRRSIGVATAKKLAKAFDRNDHDFCLINISIDKTNKLH